MTFLVSSRGRQSCGKCDFTAGAPRAIRVPGQYPGDCEMKDRHGAPLSRRDVVALCVGLGTGQMVPGLNRHASAQTASSPLFTRRIPRSGEVLPVIGLGTANGWDSGNDPAEQAARAAVVRALVGAGGK